MNAEYNFEGSQEEAGQEELLAAFFWAFFTCHRHLCLQIEKYESSYHIFAEGLHFHPVPNSLLKLGRRQRAESRSKLGHGSNTCFPEGFAGAPPWAPVLEAIVPSVILEGQGSSRKEMSSYFPRTKDLTRTRRSVTDSPPSSPSPTDKSFRHDRLTRFDSSGENVTDRLGRTSSYTRRETRLASLSKQEQDSTSKDYKKMYAEALQENERLKSRLQDSKQELVHIRSQLEKVTQRQDRIAEKSTLLESEKKEKHALEKKVSGMEEEMKPLPILQQVDLHIGI
ncbi:protein phosphatase 1 regulatory subunit 12A-like isoform X2 [Syngnathoides biaculeatus]|uniref:protein phosphatase 1 regulatory subunit 12A-like isoform X2 n=1 Tax=Syngnathoides biaculeatus TaxID=300417 RepID=UPI002ADD9A62|nr:protein phosphatase 1 regulatory subunit 12A-like isoform X2 [Syngnathoides biaculeatus]